MRHGIFSKRARRLVFGGIVQKTCRVLFLALPILVTGAFAQNAQAIGICNDNSVVVTHKHNWWSWWREDYYVTNNCWYAQTIIVWRANCPGLACGPLDFSSYDKGETRYIITNVPIKAGLPK